ncbi:OmpA/MotB family protein [Desulfonatronovibrio hydrogenovorans]|uniref:OmpA/MotB family protein n=1 Tax=Desulfonatronovibrio hydrogenovorans TaxID=53245 RepID=UPI00048F9132|nr:OmpA family protein [Desulfonatronovibrio hydrogenovorans]
MNNIQDQAPFAISSSPVKNDVPTHGSWSVPWSDLMMVMFILFLVLFIFHARESRTMVPKVFLAPWEGTMRQGQMDLNLDPVYSLAHERLGSDKGSIGLEHSRDGDLIISLFGETFFNPGRTEINPQARIYMEKISEILSLAQGGIVIAGFADAGGLENSSWAISSMRAARIGQVLQDMGTIRPERMVIQAHGSNKPLVPGDSYVAAERNRRVEIRILNN